MNLGNILHLDMDAFFAAIEILDHPELRGKPVIVGAPPNQRGVVSTASYEARKYGVHSAMPSRTAGKLCPQGVFLPVRMERYAEVSRRVMRIMESFTPLVEQVSIDEAFMDVSGALRKWGDAVSLARALKERVRAETGLTASVGVATNKFLAKLASDLRKPDSLTVVPVQRDEIVAFLAPLPASRIWGVGKVTNALFARHGISTIADIQRLARRDLERLLGKAMAEHVQRLAFGIDDRPVETEYEAKSISTEHTFDEDCSDMNTLRQTMVELTEDTGRRLRRSGKLAGVVQIKVRFDDFTTLNRQCRVTPPCRSDRDLLRYSLDLLDKQKIDRPIRLLGFGVSRLEAPSRKPKQGLLFDECDDSRHGERNTRLDAAVDRLRETYGEQSIRRGLRSSGLRQSR